jgi:hypothetical protein
MSAWMEVAMNECVGGKETLSFFWRFERRCQGNRVWQSGLP